MLHHVMHTHTHAHAHTHTVPRQKKLGMDQPAPGLILHFETFELFFQSLKLMDADAVIQLHDEDICR